jgi:hypothetical protein
VSCGIHGDDQPHDSSPPLRRWQPEETEYVVEEVEVTETVDVKEEQAKL